VLAIVFLVGFVLLGRCVAEFVQERCHDVGIIQLATLVVVAVERLG